MIERFSEDEKAQVRFEREIKILVRLNRPNIVKVHTLDGEPFGRPNDFRAADFLQQMSLRHPRIPLGEIE